MIPNLHEVYKMYIWRSDTGKLVNGGEVGIRVKNSPGKNGISKEHIVSNSKWQVEI